MYRPMAHKGPIGNPPRGPGGPSGFSGLGEIPVKPPPGRDRGKIGTPKGFLGTIQTIPLLKNPGKLRGEPIPPQSYVFRAPFFGPKRAPGPSGPQTLTLGFKNGVRGQKYQSCVSKKHAEPNGRCPKRGHMLQVRAKFVFGVGPQILGSTPCPGATPSPQGLLGLQGGR